MAHPDLLPALRPLASTLAAVEALAASPLQVAARQAAKLHNEERAAIANRAKVAFEAFRTGRGTIEHWRHLADANNIAQELVRLQIASDHGETFAASEQALAAVYQRHDAGGSWTLKPAELRAIDDAVFVHSIQLRHCSRGELHKAETRVRRRREGALRGQHGADVIVCGARGQRA